MITITTASDMIVSWSIAYGKNGFPRSLTSSLYCLKTRWRSAIRSLAMCPLLDCGLGARGRACAVRPGSVGPRAVGGRRKRAETGGRLRPRRRGHAQADHQVEVQRDQASYGGREDEHVDRVEAADRVRVD